MTVPYLHKDGASTSVTFSCYQNGHKLICVDEDLLKSDPDLPMYIEAEQIDPTQLSIKDEHSLGLTIGLGIILPDEIVTRTKKSK